MGEAMQITSVQIAALGLVVTAGSVLWALFKMVTTTSDAVRKECMAEIDKRDVIASKSRHDMANGLQALIARLDLEVERLKRETVRREDMAAIESRLTSMLSKMETKVDNITDRLAGFATLEKQVQALDNRLDGAMRRVEHTR